MLSGDNAVVIAPAARSLPPQQQKKKAMIWGSGAVIVLRIILTYFAVEMPTLPYLKVGGIVLLLWIGVSLLRRTRAKARAGEGRGQDNGWSRSAPSSWPIW